MKNILKNLILLYLFFFSSVLYALEAGDIVSNTASASYTVHNRDKSVYSNTVEHELKESEAEILFLDETRTGTKSVVAGTSAYLDEDGVWQVTSSGATMIDGESVEDGIVLHLEDTEIYNVEDMAFIQVIDADRNVDRDEFDIIEVTVTSQNGDSEVIRLRETGKNTGIFVGYIPLAYGEGTPNDSILNVDVGETIDTNYEDNRVAIKSDNALIILKKNLKLWVEKEVNKEESSVGEVLEYTLVAHNDEKFDIKSVIIHDALPLGLKLIQGTVKIEDAKGVVTKLSADGKELSFEVERFKANSELKITFLATITAGVHKHKVTNVAWVTQTEGYHSKEVSVTTLIKEELMRSKGIIVGKISDQNSKGVAGVRLYMESGRYVVSDENGKYHFDDIDAGRHIVQVDKALLPLGYEMGTCQETARHAGKNFSQFVNLGRGALKKVDFCLNYDGKKLAKKNQAEAYAIPTKVAQMPEYGLTELKKKEKRAILWPPVGYVPTVPSIQIAVKHAKGESIKILLNGQEVDKINANGVVVSKKSANIIELYKGVDLLERGNMLEVEFYSKEKKLLQKLTRKVQVSSVPVKVEYVKENSQTIADGKSSPVIAVRFLDDLGKPLRSGITGSFSIEAPYTSQEAIDNQKKNPLSTVSSENHYTVHSDGIAYIRLQPTTDSGEVTLHFNLQGRDERVRAWLKPALREWIMVGFVEGTVGYNKLSGHKESLDDIDAKDKVIKEGRVSFFAKGRVKGEWLLSMAYDTGKDTSNSKFFDEVDPNAYYTLYNDNSEQNHEAATRKKLYVKLEKSQFNLLFGDYSTDLSYTELASYSRRFTGLKSEYHGENFEAKAFAAYTEQLFVKDEIRGDGTTGYYQLKSKNIIRSSEKVTIEVRNRYRAEEIISTKVLKRFRDYEIDYVSGKINFKEPIYANDRAFNPRFIIVDYEIMGEGGKHYTYGGRGALKAMSGDIEVGATYLNEDSGKKSSDLFGADVTVKVGASTKLKAEYAKSHTTENTLSVEGEAKLAELEYVADGLSTRAYVREQESNFGLGQLSEALGGTRKVGLDVRKQFDNRQSHTLTLYRDSDLLTGEYGDVAEYRMDWNQVRWSVFTGYRYSKQSIDEGTAQQILFGASYGFFDQRLKLSLGHEETISAVESSLFPSKTTVGLNYALNSSVDLFGTYEWTDELEQGRVGLRVQPWEGMRVENTTLTEFSNDNQNVYNTLGGVQTLQVNDKLSVNFGYEQGKIINSNTTVLDANKSRKEEGFVAYNAGANYHDESYTASITGEVRKGDEEDKFNVTTAVYTQASKELALALSGRLNNTKRKKSKELDADVRLSMAYRPEDGTTIILDKLDFISSDISDEKRAFKTEKMVNNLNVNLSPTSKSELSLQYGLKYVVDSIDDFEYTGVTQLFGLDTRYDITKSWELGLQGSLLYAQSANNMDYGLGIYSGHNLFDNMVLTIGYNWKGFDDRDFSLQTYRVEGPYFRFNMKFDQESLKDTVRMMSW